jgi:hypothetical protein
MEETTTEKKSELSCSRRAHWLTLHASMTSFHGSCNLPLSPPTKEDCSAALSRISFHAPPQEVSEFATLFQYRKTFKASTNMEAEFLSFKKAATRPNSPLTPLFKQAVAAAIALLPKDWDRLYLSKVETTVPNFKSNLEGLRPHQLPPMSAEVFKDICTGYLPPVHIPNKRTWMAFPDAGKLRSVTIASILMLQLSPLSSTLYDALVGTGAVLKGPATPFTLSQFTTCPDEVMVSGDYKSSTNNFELYCTQYIIEKLKQSSTRIPPAIWDLLLNFMGGCTIHHKKFPSFERTNCQLMGDRPSFPLLCFTNLVGFIQGLGAARAKEIITARRLRINGDDIAFRARQAEFEQWKNRLPQAGLVLEETKTLVHQRVVTLNSTYFRTRPSRRPQQIFFLRMSSIFPTSSARPKQRRQPLFQAKEHSSFLAAVSENLKHFQNKGVEALRFHLLRSRPRLTARPLPSDFTSPDWNLKSLPPPTRRSLSSFKLLSRLRTRPQCPPPVRFSNVQLLAYKPRTTPDWSFHNQCAQLAGFRRVKPEPEDLLLYPPRPKSILGLSYFRDPYVPKAHHTRLGLGYQRPDLFYYPGTRCPQLSLNPEPPPRYASFRRATLT